MQISLSFIKALIPVPPCVQDIASLRCAGVFVAHCVVKVAPHMYESSISFSTYNYFTTKFPPPIHSPIHPYSERASTVTLVPAHHSFLDVIYWATSLVCKQYLVLKPPLLNTIYYNYIMSQIIMITIKKKKTTKK